MDASSSIHPTNQLRQERVRHNWRQQDLADKLGTTVGTVKRWERGSQQPSAYFRIKLCALFGKSIEELGLLPEEIPSHDITKAKVSVPEANFDIPLSGALPGLWSVPYPRNPFFTGRIAFLQALHEQLSVHQSVALNQSYALSGLGGIGKTQLAMEYIYQHALDYQAVFWIVAETLDTIDASFTTIAELLHLPEYEERDRHKIVKAVLHWLVTHKDWLLIFDNVESISLIKPFLPIARQGAILMTTRLHALDGFAHTLELPPLSREEGIQFLLRRAKYDDRYSSSKQDDPKMLKVAETLVEMMDGLPLALDQVGAYIEHTRCSFLSYLQMYQSHPVQLLAERSKLAEHPHSVVKTILLSFQKLTQMNEGAADILRLCAFLAPDAIPEELFTKGAVSLGPKLDAVIADTYRFNLIIGDALQYSLLHRQAQYHTFSQHRLVQVVLKATMDEKTSRLWASRAATSISASISASQKKHAHMHDDRYVPHARSVLQSVHLWDEEYRQTLCAAIWYYIGSVAEQYSQLIEARDAFLQGLAIAHDSHSPLEAALLVHTGFMTSDLGNDQQALQYLEHGVELARQMHDEETLCFALLHQGQIQDNHGNYQLATSLYQEGLTVALRLQDWAIASHFLQDLGVQAVRRGDYKQTEFFYCEGLIYAQRSHQLERESALQMNRGMLAIHRQQYDLALKYSLESLEIAQKIHHRYRISSVSQNIGIIYRLLDQLEQAQHYLNESLCLAQEIQNPWLIAETQGEYGWLHLAQKRSSEAQEMFESMLSGAHHIQAPELIARALFGLAQVAAQQNSWEDARSLAQESLEHYTQLGDAQQDHVSQWLNTLASSLLEQ